MAVKKGPKYTLDSRNARKHPKKNKDAARKSLESLGAGRSALADADGVMIGGNLILEQAQELGIPVREIETDGSELVVVKRTDLKTEDPKRKAMALADNQIGTLAEWDEEQRNALLDECGMDLDVMGFDDEEALDAVKPQPPEVEFSEALLESNNYVVLFFKNDVDWLSAQTHFELDTVASKRSNGKAWSRGIGRVIDGAKYLTKLKGTG